MNEKIKVLFLAANPIDAGRLRLDEEAREIRRKIEGGTHRSSFELICQFAARPNTLQHVLLQHRPHIVHFSGHGKGPQGILLEDEAGKSKVVSLQAISNLFRILKDNVRVVIFNACYSLPQAGAFNELIDYTIGTGKNIGDEAAISFAASFYRALAFGLSVRDAFELAKNELELNAIRKPGSPKLLIRKGVDPSISLMTQIRDYAIQTSHPKHDDQISPTTRLNEVKSTVERLSAGTATDSDAETIQRALVAGSIVLERMEESKASLEKTKKRSAALKHESTRMGTMVGVRIGGMVLTKGVKGRRSTTGRSDVLKKRKKRSVALKEEGTRVGTMVEVRAGKGRSASEGVTDTLRDVREVNHSTAYREYGNWLDVELPAKAYLRVQEKLFPQPLGLPPPLPNLIFVGREEALSDVKTLLGVNQEDTTTEPKVVIIRSWPGVGKRTLVGFVARDPEVLKAFSEGVLWASIGRNPELIAKLAEWGRALGTDEILGTPSVDEAVVKLARLLRHRRMLLIVDDIWNAEHAVPFLKAAAGSKCAFLATTRLPSVAEALTSNPEEIYVLPVLTEDDALELLHYFAPTLVDEHPNECRELVQELGCLPLALHLAGRMLRTESNADLTTVVELIEEIRDGARILEEQAPLDRSEGTPLPTIQALFKSSTDELDELTRDCFAFLGAFAPKPATFDAEAMKAVWQVDDAAPIIRKLVGHGLLEPTGSGRFQMHALLVKHARTLLT